MHSKVALVRRKGRQLAVQMLASWAVNPDSPDATIARVHQLTRSNPKSLAFAERLARGVWGRLDEIDARVGGVVTPYWRENMGLVERSVLRVAVAELLLGAVPPRVVVTEFIEVGRALAGEPAAPFINGILDSILKELPEPSPELSPDPSA